MKSKIENRKSRTYKPVIGIAGGIGAGKSTVAAEFARLGCDVIDSDADARAVLNWPDVVAELTRWLGADVLDSAGRPDRAKIAKRVFGRPPEVARLNRLIHPRVHRMRREKLAERADDPAVVAFVLDTPLLFEAGVDDECDAIVFVDAPADARRKRVAVARGWSADDLAARQQHQIDLAEKRARCGYVIRNDGDRESLSDQVKDVLGRILGGRS